VLGGDQPGELVGWGVLDPEACRELALDGAFRRWVADPLTGELLDVGAHEYVPSEMLRRFVIARDRTCAWANCNRPAVLCDLDHRVPFRGDKKLRNRKGRGRKRRRKNRRHGPAQEGPAQEGPAQEGPAQEGPAQDGLTVRANLGPLCRRHHRIKHRTEWTVERLEDGAVLWTSPCGATYLKPIQRYLDADDLLAAPPSGGSAMASAEGHPPPDTPLPAPPPPDHPRSKTRPSDPWWPPEQPPSRASDAPPF
jgi:hypothetical protein